MKMFSMTISIPQKVASEIFREKNDGVGITERLLERVTCWLIQSTDECHLYQAVDLPPVWNGLPQFGNSHLQIAVWYRAAWEPSDVWAMLNPVLPNS